MNHLKGLFIGFALFAIASTVWAADSAGSITITSPADNAVLQSGTGNKLAFNVRLGPNGNHVHIYVDDQNPIVFRDVSHCPCRHRLAESVARQTYHRGERGDVQPCYDRGAGFCDSHG